MRKHLVVASSSEVQKEAQEPMPTIQKDERLEEAIKAVYRRYGPNLPAFFRDAYEEAARKHRDSSDKTIEAM